MASGKGGGLVPNSPIQTKWAASDPSDRYDPEAIKRLLERTDYSFKYREPIIHLSPAQWDDVKRMAADGNQLAQWVLERK